MEPEFPLEFIVLGTPVSFQGTRRSRSKLEWKELVQRSAQARLPEMSFATSQNLAVTLYYFPEDTMPGDLDNIVKLTLDAMNRLVYVDDKQIERIVIQRFERSRIFAFLSPTETLLACLFGEKPALYVRLSDDPYEELRA